MLESKGGILFIAGIGFFAFAFLSNVAVPMLMFKDLPEQTVEEVINDRVMYQFTELSARYPEPFREAFGEPMWCFCFWMPHNASVKSTSNFAITWCTSTNLACLWSTSGIFAKARPLANGPATCATKSQCCTTVLLV